MRNAGIQFEDNYDKTFARLIGHEGAYVNNPKDPGGETQWGITWPFLREAIARGLVPADMTIQGLTREHARPIYKALLWDVLVDAHPAVKFQLFDFAVNSGIDTAIRKLQLAVGAADDGRWGERSAAALAAMDLNDVLMRLSAYRLKFMAKLKNLPNAAGGWMNRIADNLLYSAEDN